ncbi:MAG: TonB-dependent receptor [Ignavibacteriaceae bacterium]
MKAKTHELKIRDIFFTLIITLLLCSHIFGYSPAKIGLIKGIITDQSTGQPLAGATILLLRDENEEYINGTSTDKNGLFEFSSLELAQYTVRIRFVGYQTKVLKAISLTEERQEFDVRKIELEPMPLEIEEVSVTGEKPLVRFEAGKQIIDVDKNILSSSGSAVDVLKMSPTVEVDAQGNVSLRGETNVKILIDGKPSSVSGDNNNNVLQQIPASAIENIEIITNPSAKYEAEGITGIININLKKKTEQGVNGMISVSGGTGDRYNSSLNFNYNPGMFNLFANYDFMSVINKVTNRVTRTTSAADTLSYYVQDGLIYEKSRMNSTKAGFDFTPSPEYFFTLYTNYRYNSPDIGWDMDFNNYLNNTPNSSYSRSLKAKQPFESVDIVFNSKRMFEHKGNELTFDVYYSRFEMNADVLYGFSPVSGNPQIPFFPSGSRNAFMENIISTYTAQMDYILPFEKGDRFESGVKGIIRGYDSDFRTLSNTIVPMQWTIEPNSQDEFRHKEYIYSAYTMYSGTIDAFNYQAGLRTELTDLTTELVNGKISNKNDYTDLFPSAAAGYKFNETDQIQFTYGRRINRPNVWMLNPWKNNMDPLNLRYGSITLSPEYTNSFELTLTKFFGKHSLTPVLFYRNTSDVMTQYSFLGTDGVINNTFVNGAKSTNFGMDLTYQASVFPWWTLGTTLSYYKQILKSEIPGLAVDRSDYLWNGRINSNFTLTEDLSMQMFGLYRPAVVFPQGKRNEFYFMDFALKYDFLEKKASVTLRVSDVLKSMKFTNTSSGTGYSLENRFEPNQQQISLGFSYRLNNGPKFTDRKKEPESIQMMNSY